MLDVSELFPGALVGPYLNTASMALGNVRGADALRRAVSEWESGSFDWLAAEATTDALRSVIADLMVADPRDVALVTGASGGASTVAAQLPDAASGKNVVVPARDFSSNFLPWTMLSDRGYEVRLVPDDDGELLTDRFAAVVDDDTAVVATSTVQSASGFRVDLDALKQLTADRGTWLVVDASQSLGCVHVDLEGIDALFSCSHKWLCGVRGMGYLYVNPELLDSFRPITPGWRSTSEPMSSFYGPSIELASTAAKLDVSTPWFDPLVNIEGARIVAETGIREIEAHNDGLIGSLEAHGVELAFSPRNRSHIVSIEVADVERTSERLRSSGITASVRAGKLRVSVHLYNTAEDVAQLVACLR